ncbi:probable protein S-acyltransferase 1 [Ricinus communis]|uniref:probable protein S-acyltransferase 1 n=1 Tax=Ricinus communis TaxID=3988 RepID=UPI0007725236|nr:probable protein S-acyltransferase 1 [Ricinus communis]|eukprot:XP_015577875.1 probable protein S-acyltransferase 1 isoform X2 [Ricinus communis]
MAIAILIFSLYSIFSSVFFSPPPMVARGFKEADGGGKLRFMRWLELKWANMEDWAFEAQDKVTALQFFKIQLLKVFSLIEEIEKKIKTMEPTNSQGSEVDFPMEAIALSTPPKTKAPAKQESEDGGGNKSEGENKTAKRLGNILVTVKGKFAAIIKLVEDKWLKQCGFSAYSDTTRAYQIWPGNNVFLFHGRLVCGPDPRGLLLTTVSIVITSWIFAVYNDDDLRLHSTLIVTLSLILTTSVLVNLFLVSSTDPGIIARNYQTPLEEIGTSEGSRRKKVTINGVELKLKYCGICKIFRPPRSCHCAICNNCVEKFDHHCPWIGQCVALRNYRFYMTFVISALNFFIYIFVFSFWRIQRRMSRIGSGLIGMLMNCPETLALVLFSFAAIWFLGGLAIFHVYLIAINQTAYENFRQFYVGCRNPFDKGILSNIKEALFSALPPSGVDFREVVPSGHPNAARELV